MGSPLLRLSTSSCSSGHRGLIYPARQRPTATLPRRCGSPVTAMCNTLFQNVKSLPEVRCEFRCNHFKPTGSGRSSTTPSLLTCCQSCGALFGMTTPGRLSNNSSAANRKGN
ncbi:hypothetical protein pipiens_013059 [Culex pipiens pipiens]|uniref:Uncharacterized protein n=1 Tax=Culex pipiens pipiens TaxID=38569 RepID=A0ABD1D056_CULPP